MDEDILDVNEWIQYAQDDFDLAVSIAEANNPYAPKMVCLHCQQSAEKILKAYSIAKDGTRIKEHDLEKLLRRCERHSPDFNDFTSACSILDTYISKTRYPSTKKLTVANMKQALKDAAQILEFTKAKLKELGHEYTVEQDTPR